MSRLFVLIAVVFAYPAFTAAPPVGSSTVKGVLVEADTLEASEFWTGFEKLETGMSRRSVRALLGPPQGQGTIPCRSHYRGPGEGLCYVEDPETGRVRPSAIDFDEWSWSYDGVFGDSLAHVFFVANGDSVVAHYTTSSTYIY